MGEKKWGTLPPNGSKHWDHLAIRFFYPAANAGEVSTCLFSGDLENEEEKGGGKPILGGPRVSMRSVPEVKPLYYDPGGGKRQEQIEPQDYHFKSEN